MLYAISQVRINVKNNNPQDKNNAYRSLFTCELNRQKL